MGIDVTVKIITKKYEKWGPEIERSGEVLMFSSFPIRSQSVLSKIISCISLKYKHIIIPIS